MMTKKQFNEMMDKLVNDYTEKDDEIGVLEYLENEGVRFDDLKEIDPMDVIRYLNKLNLNWEIRTKDNNDYSIKFRMALRICEYLEYVHRPTPKFDTYDLIQGSDGFVYTVMDYDYDDDSYCLDITLNGESEYKTREYIEKNFVKIGECRNVKPWIDSNGKRVIP